MNHADPRVRRGAHRSGRNVAGALVPSLLAILAVTSLITAVNVWHGHDVDAPSAAAATRSHPATTPATATATTAAATTTQPATTAPATPTTSPPSSAPESSASTGRDVEVVVLNQTSRGGLAASVADRLRKRGWTVGAVGNFHGVVPATTVYYPPGREAAAQAAAESLPTTPRIRPRFGNLSTTRLTVVVTADYPA